jgi:hypothetical protein
MLREVGVRAVIQRNNATRDKYYPAVVSASTTHSYPFSVPSATIEIVTNTNSKTSGYTSPFKVDDIIRLQVYTKMNTNEKTVWEELFSGRIRSIKGTYGSKNTTEIFAVGHLEEAEWSLIEEDYTYSSNIDATDILNRLYNVAKTTDSPAMTGYKRVITFDHAYALDGIKIPEYSTKKDQTHVSDVFSEIEKISGSDWYIDCFPVYDIDQNLADIFLTWSPFPSTPTENYKIIEGTERFIECDFESSIEELVTFYKVSGDTPASKTPTVKSSGTGKNCDISAGFTGSSHDGLSCSFSGSVDIDHGHGMGNSSSSALVNLAGGTASFLTGASVTGYSSSGKAVTGSGSTGKFTPSGSVSPSLTIDPLTVVPTPQLSGKKATDTSLIGKYGKRSLIETFTWIKSSAQCQAIADGIISDRGMAQKSGTVKIILTPAAHIGDLVYTKLPSVEVDGASINENFTVFKVQHSISQNSAITTLDLGRVVKTAYDYIGLVAKVAKTCKKNFCKG